MLSLHDSLQKIQETKWSYTTNFMILFEFDKDNKIASKCGLTDLDLNLYIKQFSMPQIGASNVIEKFTLDRPRIAMGTWEPFSIKVTFQDFDNLNLYKKFVTYLSLERFSYFDDYKFSLKLMKLADHKSDPNEKLVAVIDKCYIQNISQITFTNESEGQILEFDIEIKCGKLKEVQGFKEELLSGFSLNDVFKNFLNK